MWILDVDVDIDIDTDDYYYYTYPDSGVNEAWIFWFFFFL